MLGTDENVRMNSRAMFFKRILHLDAPVLYHMQKLTFICFLETGCRLEDYQE